METKDAIIGFLIIGMVTVSGWVGFLYVNPTTKTIKKTDEETKYIFIETPPTYLSGLPDDWSTAPNASKIILYNETGDTVEITLGQILDYVKKYEETSQHQDWYEKRLPTVTLNDPSGIPITGVDLLEVLRVFDCNFAGEIKLTSHNDTVSTLSYDVVELCNAYGGDRYTILALAANKQWLPESLLGERCGNFSVFSRDTTLTDESEIEITCYNLADIRVTKNWTITLNVYNNDDSLNQTIIVDAFNITKAYGADPYHYEYENTAYWNFNRTYYGTNISQIVNYTKAKGTDFILNITFSPGDSQPAGKSRRGAYSYSPYFNWTDVEETIENNGTHIIGNHVDYVNWTDGQDTDGTGIPMLKSDLLMCITNKIRYGYETDGDEYNSPWDEFYNYGYPPFQLIIPGLVKSRYYNGVVGLNIKILSNTR